MNSCCVNTVEAIADNKHKPAEQCCLATDGTPAPARAQCPISKTPSRKVPRRTLEHLLTPEKVGMIQPVQYYYCADPNCTVVYFSNENVPSFTVDDVSVRVLSKNKDEDVNVCYCFNWTRARIKEEYLRTGKSTASLQIAREVRAGNCSCDITNPKGECCLGDVKAFVKSLVPTSPG